MNNELKQEMTERFNSAYGEEVKIGLREALRKVYINGGEHGYQYAIQHPQWIPVEEELPKEKGKYMFRLSNGDMYYTTYYPKLKLQDNVTHWMEIVPPQRKEA